MPGSALGTNCTSIMLDIVLDSMLDSMLDIMLDTNYYRQYRPTTATCNYIKSERSKHQLL